MKRYLLPILLLLPLLIVGCKSSTSSTTLSSVAQLSTFAFASNDSFPGLAAATFKIEERLDTGYVYNPDSILYGTPLDSVVPVFTFAATPGSVLLQTADTTIVLSGKDTINFNRTPIYLTVKSSDGTTTKVYEINATVHQVDPDLFTWECLTEQAFTPDNSAMQVLLLRDQFVCMKDNGFHLSFYRSADGVTWTEAGTPSGLPASCNVRGIVSDDEQLYYADTTGLYTSADGLQWTHETYSDFTLRTMLLSWNGAVWALAYTNGEPVLAKTEDGVMRLTPLRITSPFPVSDFAAVVFESAAFRARAMIIGGFAEDGTSLNTRWNLEYSVSDTTNGGYRLLDFSIDRPQFAGLTGISVVWYNHSLYMFGGVDTTMQYRGRDIFVSTDEGLSWATADTSKCALPDTYTPRQRLSSLVYDDNIYLFGGETQDASYSDVYRGRLNSIDW